MFLGPTQRGSIQPGLLWWDLQPQRDVPQESTVSADINLNYIRAKGASEESVNPNSTTSLPQIFMLIDPNIKLTQ